MNFLKQILGKFFGFIFLSALLLNVALAPLMVKAQEASPAPSETPAAIPTPSATPDPTPSATPTPAETPQPSLTPTPSESPAPTAEPSVSPTPSETPSPTPAATPQPSETPTPSVSPTPSPEPSSTPAPTPAPVTIGTSYTSPNGQAKVKFNSISGTAGTLTINETTLSSQQITQLGALSNVVYDLSSSMANGSFSYDLTLPYPAGVTGTNFKVLYASDINGLTNGSQVNQSITDNGDGTFTIHNLDHFTVFVVVNPNTQANCDAIQVGATCYTTVQAAVNAASNGDTIYVGATGSPYNETVYVNKQLTFQGVGNPSVNAFVLQTTPVTITGITTSVSIANPTINSLVVANANNQASYPISGTGPANATVNYTITGTSGSTNGSAVINSSGTFSFTANLSALGQGSFTVDIQLTSGSYSSGHVQATQNKDSIAPAAPSITTSPPAYIGPANQTSVSFSGAAEAGTTVNWTISNGGFSVSGSTTATGDGTFSVSNVNVSSLADGTLTLTLTVTDAAGNTSTSTTATSTKDTVSPTVNAGSNVSKNVTFTTSSTVSDPSPSSDGLTYQWTKQSGPGSVTFGSATSQNTTVSASQDGAYVVRLTVSDNAGNSAFSEFSLNWDTQTPSVNAGSNQIKNAGFTTSSTVSDPSPSSDGLTYQWTKQSGPGTLTFGSATSQNTTVSANTDGAYVIRLTVTDAAGNSAFSEFSLTWDTVAPTVSAGSNQTKNALFSQTGTATDATSGIASTVWSQVSGPGTITFGTPSVLNTTVSASAEGTYVIRLTVTDAAGNSAFSEFSLTWDTVAPAVNAGSNVSKNAVFTTSASASDATSGITSYSWIMVSGPGVITFGTPNAQNTTVSASAEGTYVIRLTVTDAAGNSAFSEFTLTWDTVVPTVNAGSNVSKNALFTTNATSADPSPSSGIASYLWTQVSGPGTITFGTANALNTFVTASQDGAYVVRLTVTDNAGNTNNSQFSLNWDTVAPSVDAGTDKIKNAIFTQDATVTDPVPSSDSLVYQWTQVSGPGTITFGSATSEDTTVSADQDGTYVIQLTVTDAAGNSAADTFSLVWDTVAPTVSAGSNVSKNSSFTTSSTVSDTSPSSGGLTYAWTKQSGPGTITFGTSTAQNTTVSANADGAYVIRLTVTDAAGNSAFSEFSLTWDTVAPAVNAGSNVIKNALFTTSATASDATSGITSYSWIMVSGPGTITFGTANALNTTASADTDGAYVIRLTVTDAAGNSAFSEFSLTWDTVAPAVNAGSNQTKNALFSQTGTAADATSGVATTIWSQVSGPGTVTFGTPNSLTTTISANMDGVYVVRLTVTDNAGNSAFSEFSLTWDTVAPAVNAGSNVIKNALFTTSATASDATSGITSYSWIMVSGPGVITFGTANALNTTVSADLDGAYVIRLTVTDAAGNSANSQFSLVWDSASPVVSAGGNITTNALFSRTGTATDPSPSSGISTTVWTQVSGPGVVTFSSPNTLTTNISASVDGVYVIMLTVTDAAGNTTTATFTLTWDTTNPTVSAGSNQTKNALFSQTGTATDATSGIASTVWSQVSGPGTITFGSVNALTTTISANMDGVYVVRLTVTDNAGNSASSTFTLTWDTTNPTVNAGTYNPQKALFTTFATASDATSGIASYSWTQVSGPGVITFGTSTASNTTVSADLDGTYTIRLTVTDSAGNSSFSDSTFVWDATAPTVSTGGAPNPQNALFTQVGSASDTTSGISTIAWSQVSGPGTVTFGTANATITTISANQDGTYIVKLTITDNAGNSAESTLTFVWDTTVPTVSAGTSPQNKNAFFTQDGSATDATSGIQSVTWSQVSGPGTITFGSPNATTTTISASADGVYVIQLSATDNAGNTTTATFTLNWDTAAPTVSAGSDQLKNSTFTQTGTVSDPAPSSDGLTYTWAKVSGPGNVFFGSSTAISTTVSADQDGTYVISLTVTDAAGNSTGSLFNLTWDTTAPTGSWTAPQAGSIVSGNVTLAAAVSDGTIAFSYKRNDGLDTFHNITGSIWNTSGLVLDNYTLRLTVTDAAGNSVDIDQTVGLATIISSSTIQTNSASSSGIVITWTTADLTTSRVIFDIVSHSALGLSPNYGYAFSTAVFDLVKVLNHSVPLTGLLPNTTYYYRVVSTGSPEAVSSEFSFSTLPQPSGGSSSSGGGGGGGDGSSSGGGGGASVCTGGAKPGSAPKLLSAIVTGLNQITLTWSKALDPVTFYLITYGTKPGLQQYGNPNVGGPNTTTYTVGYLKPGVRYYFKVRAGNNCVPGDFSNEVSAVASGKFVASNVAAGFFPGVLGTKKTPAFKKNPAITPSIQIPGNIPSYTPITPKSKQKSSGLLEDVIQFFQKKLSFKLP